MKWHPRHISGEMTFWSCFGCEGGDLKLHNFQREKKGFSFNIGVPSIVIERLVTGVSNILEIDNFVKDNGFLDVKSLVFNSTLFSF